MYDTKPERHFGVLAFRQGQYLFVSMPGIAQRPTDIIRLTGRIQIGTHSSLDTILTSSEPIAAYATTVATPDGHDLATVPVIKDPNSRELRIFNATLALANHPLPAGFTSIIESEPEDEEPVLALRLTADPDNPYKLIRARYMPDYRYRDPWRDISCRQADQPDTPIVAWLPIANAKHLHLAA